MQGCLEPRAPQGGEESLSDYNYEPQSYHPTIYQQAGARKTLKGLPARVQTMDGMGEGGPSSPQKQKLYFSSHIYTIFKSSENSIHFDHFYPIPYSHPLHSYADSFFPSHFHS